MMFLHNFFTFWLFPISKRQKLGYISLNWTNQQKKDTLFKMEVTTQHRTFDLTLLGDYYTNGSYGLGLNQVTGRGIVIMAD